MNFLPIGTVVSVDKPEQAKRMIIGYFPQKEQCIYDYLAVAYPIGMFFDNTVCCLNSEQITAIDKKGYQDELFLRMAKNMARLEKQIRSGENG